MKVKEGIDINEIFSILWRDRKLILIFQAFVSIFIVIYSLSLSDIYKSSAILAPTDDSSSLADLAGQYSSIASVAGISLPSSGEVDKIAMSVEIMQSFVFFEYIVNKYDLLFNLVAVEDWDKASNTFVVDKDIYDTKNKKYVSDIDYAVEGKPTLQYAHREIFLEIFNVSTDIKTGFVSISYEHVSPYFAKEIIDLIIFEINEITRNDDMQLAERSIKFLDEEISKTTLSDIRYGLNILKQKNIEKIMLAKTSPDYLFKVLSPAIASEKKAKPSRAVICILGFLLGLAFICVIVIIREEYFNKN